MGSSNSFFRSVTLRGGENDVQLAAAEGNELGVVVSVTAASPLGSTVRFSFEPAAGEPNSVSDSFLMREASVGDGPVSFMLAAGQILYVGCDQGVSAAVSANAYPLSPADAPYLI